MMHDSALHCPGSAEPCTCTGNVVPSEDRPFWCTVQLSLALVQVMWFLLKIDPFGTYVLSFLYKLKGLSSTVYTISSNL